MKGKLKCPYKKTVSRFFVYGTTDHIYFTNIFISYTLQVVGLNLRDLLAEVDKEIQILPPAAQKEVSILN